MLLLKDECALCGRIVSSSYLRRCLRCGKLYCFDCSTFTPDGYIVCLNCARREVSPRKLGTKYSPLNRYLLRRGVFTERVVLSLGEIEGIICNNLPLTATRDDEWWRNTRSTPQGRGWMDVGWNVESVDISNHKVILVKVAKPQAAVGKKEKRKKKTEFFKRPIVSFRRKKPLQPSKTRIAQAQARLRNIERSRSASQQYTSKFRTRSAHEKRLFKPDAKPSKSSN